MAASLDRELYLGSPKKVALHPAFSYAWSQGLQHIISLPPCPLITRTFSDIAIAQWPRPGNPQIAILLPSSWPIFKFGQFSMLLMVIYFMSGSGSRSHTVFTCHVSSDSFNLGQFISLCLLRPWILFWSVQTSYVVDSLSICGLIIRFRLWIWGWNNTKVLCPPYLDICPILVMLISMPWLMWWSGFLHCEDIIFPLLYKSNLWRDA